MRRIVFGRGVRLPGAQHIKTGTTIKVIPVFAVDLSELYSDTFLKVYKCRDMLPFFIFLFTPFHARIHLFSESSDP